MNNADDGSMNAASETTAYATSEEPIKISIYTSDDGQYHMKYDCNDIDGAEMTKSKRKSTSNKSPSSAKPATETLYEIDLYCDVCNHDYKSLMSLNRHMRTRKHLNQLAKLNEANEQVAVDRDWSNYDSYLNTYDLMPCNVYNSIVRTILDEGDDVHETAMVTDPSSTLTAQHNDSDHSFQFTYDSYDDCNNQYATTKCADNRDVFDDIRAAMDVTTSDGDETYDENKAIVDIIQRSMCNKCLVCGEVFSSAQLLHEHTREMRENCAAKIVDDKFDLGTELQRLEFSWNGSSCCQKWKTNRSFFGSVQIEYFHSEFWKRRH